MRRLVSCILSLSALVATKDAAPAPRSTERSITTKHFIVEWSRADIAESKAREVSQAAEASMSKVLDFLRERRPIREPIVIRLEGWGQPPKVVPAKVPYVDGAGIIHLYEYSSSGYLGQIAHETVHAVRRRLGPRSGPFVEEGIASLAAERVDPERRGFFLYGFPFDVVAGQWTGTPQEFISMRIARLRHHDLNLPCQYQIYPLRASFFVFLDEQFGRRAVLALADGSGDDDARYATLFKETFTTLDVRWREWLTARFRKHRGGPDLAGKYRTTTPIRFRRACRTGVDF